MSEQAEKYREHIESLKQESKNLDQAIYNAKVQKQQKFMQQGELQRQNRIKKTIEVMDNQNRLVADEIPMNAQIVSYSNQTPVQKQSDIDSGKSAGKLPMNPVRIVNILLSAIIIVCTLRSWLSFAGQEFDLKTVMEGLNYARSWGVDSYVNKYIGIAVLLLGIVYVIGVIYVWIIIRIIKGKNIKVAAIVGTVWSVLVLAFFLLMVAATEDSTYGLSRAMQVNMKAYIAILLSIVILVLACIDKQKKSVQGEQTRDGQIPGTDGTEVEYAVTNYYPWMNLQMLYGIVKQGTASEFSVSYACQEQPVSEIAAVKMGSRVNVLTDIVITAVNGIYAVKDAELQITDLEKEGRTESIYLNANVGQVQSLKVYVKAVVVAEKEKMMTAGFHVDSTETSEELQQYRIASGNRTAVCKPEVAEDGIICACGLYHAQDRQCGVCGQ